jgi:ADP-heptose:LPS heptosyltransferase
MKIETGQNISVDVEPQARETARYIADITGGFSALARKAGLDVLAYILDMAKLEAEETAQKPEAH